MTNKDGPNYGGMPAQWLLKRVREELLDVLTDPASGFESAEAAWFWQKFLDGETVPRSFPLDGRAVKWGQDHGLSVDQIEQLRDGLFGKKEG